MPRIFVKRIPNARHSLLVSAEDDEERRTLLSCSADLKHHGRHAVDTPLTARVGATSWVEADDQEADDVAASVVDDVVDDAKRAS